MLHAVLFTACNQSFIPPFHIKIIINNKKVIMKKITYLLLFFLLSATGLSAEEQTTLIVNLRDGTVASFELSEKPRITFTADEMQVISSTGETTFMRTDIKNYLFGATTTVIDKITTDDSIFTVKENMLTLVGLPAGSAVTIFTTEGICVVNGQANDDGNFTHSLNSLSAGIYLINYNNRTIKYLRK